MKIAIITPYYKEHIDIIRRCHDSVVNQTHKNIKHIIISDGYPKEEIDSWDCIHIKIPACADYGDTPRGIGALVASSLGFDGICFIDADCWCDPDHIQSLIEKQRETASLIITCPRNLYREDGTFMAVDVESNGTDFNDTNCYMFFRPAFPYLQMWLMKDKKISAVGDRVLWQYIVNSKIAVGRSIRESLNYTTTFTNHYLSHGEVPPPSSKIIVSINGQQKTISFAEYQKLLETQKEQELRYKKVMALAEAPVDIQLPLKNTRMFQILFKENQEEKLDKSFMPYDNMSNERPDLREWYSWQKIHGSKLVEDVEYWGAVSLKFKEKTKINGNTFLKFVNDNPGYDLYHICPSWVNRKLDPFNVWLDGDKYHPGLSNIANTILSKLGYDVDVKSLKMTTYFFCNFFVANKTFWNRYMEFIDSIFRICEQDSELFDAVFTAGKSKYFQEPTAPMFPFLIERFTPTFVMLHDFKALSFSQLIDME